MQLKDWQIFWQGYVVISVEGKAPEKFINLAMVQGIPLWDVIPLGEHCFLAKVAIKQVNSLRPIARITKTRFRIKQKRGFPFVLRRARRRKMFLAGALVFIILLYSLSAVIWFVDWSSQEELENLSHHEVLQLAAEHGLRPGALKSSLNLKEIEKNLEIELPQLAWAGIEIQGTRAIIRVVEKSIPSEEQLDRKPGHLVAVKEGVLYELLVIDGKPLVQIGDTITEGQILVSGIMTSSQGEESGENQWSGLPQLVRARGVARARVWYEGHGEIPLVEEGERYTGKEVTVLRLEIAGKQITLKGPKTIPFSQYREKETAHKMVPWRNWQVPVELLKITYYQVEPYQRVLGRKEAQELALEKALAVITEQVPSSSRVINQREQVEEAPEGIVRMRVIVEAIEEIAKFQPLT